MVEMVAIIASESRARLNWSQHSRSKGNGSGDCDGDCGSRVGILTDLATPAIFGRRSGYTRSDGSNSSGRNDEVGACQFRVSTVVETAAINTFECRARYD